MTSTVPRSFKVVWLWGEAVVMTRLSGPGVGISASPSLNASHLAGSHTAVFVMFDDVGRKRNTRVKSVITSQNFGQKKLEIMLSSKAKSEELPDLYPRHESKAIVTIKPDPTVIYSDQVSHKVVGQGVGKHVAVSTVAYY